MGMSKTNDNKEKQKQNVESVKGTMFSVGLVGVVILITYVVLYGLYMARV